MKLKQSPGNKSRSARKRDPNAAKRSVTKAAVADTTRRAASLRKLDPTAKPPTPSVVRRMSRDDVELLERVLADTMECIFHRSFTLPNSEASLLAPLDEIDDREYAVFGGNPDAPAASSTKSLTAADEQRLFLCLNFCRYRAMRVVRDHGDRRLTAAATRDLLKWVRRVAKVRKHIIQANLSLVPAMAKRSKTIGVDIGDLICEGNLALLRSVDKFDCARGFKFSTYACRAILSSFSSSSAKNARYRTHFPTEFDPALEKSDHLERQREDEEEDSITGLKTVLAHNRANLSGIERDVLKARFDLEQPNTYEGPPRSKTLKQVAELIGVTKERVRQIQNKALDKLRVAMEDDVLAA